MTELQIGHRQHNTINANITADYQIIDASGYGMMHLTNVADSDFVNLSENDRYKIVDGNNGEKFQIKLMQQMLIKFILLGLTK